jgi:hypothetical protein
VPFDNKVVFIILVIIFPRGNEGRGFAEVKNNAEIWHIVACFSRL